MNFDSVDAVVHHTHDVPGEGVGLSVHAGVPSTAHDFTAGEELSCSGRGEERKKRKEKINQNSSNMKKYN